MVNRNTIVSTIAVSPILLIAVLLETFARDAYPPDGDTLFIPFASYLFFYFLFWLLVSLEIETRSPIGNWILFWNSKRNGHSLATLVVSVLIFWFWLSFLFISVNVAAIGSAIVCTIMLLVIPAARTLAIQDSVAPPKQRSETFTWENVDSRCTYLDEKYETLRANLEQMENHGG